MAQRKTKKKKRINLNLHKSFLNLKHEPKLGYKAEPLDSDKPLSLVWAMRVGYMSRTTPKYKGRKKQ